MVDLYRASDRTPAGYRFQNPEDRLLSGRHGGVFFVTDTKSGKRGEVLYKEYNYPLEGEKSAKYRHRINLVVDRLEGYDGAHGLRDHMLALPTAVVEREDRSAFGVLMQAIYRSDGTIAQQLNVDQVRREPLATRLLIALGITGQMHLLDAGGFIHCDFNPGNILYTGDPASRMAQVIDVDTAALRDLSHPGRYYREIDSDVLNHGQSTESYLAPEIYNWTSDKPRGNMATQEAEYWSLAVLLHGILCGYEDPYSFYGVNYLEATNTYIPWPPNPTEVVGANKPAAKIVRKNLSFLGEQIERQFWKVFQRNGTAEFRPDRRPTAFDWLNTLSRAAKAVVTHDACGTVYVALNGRPCPACFRG